MTCARLNGLTVQHFCARTEGIASATVTNGDEPRLYFLGGNGVLH